MTSKRVSNKEVITALKEILAAMEVKNYNNFRIRAYQNAISILENLTVSIQDLWENKRLGEIPGIGPGIEEHLNEFFLEGKVAEFEEIKKGRRIDALKFNIFKNGIEDESPAPEDENLIAEENNNLSLKTEIENTVGGNLGTKGFKYLLDNVPTDTIKLYLDNWSKFTPGRNPIGFFVKACVEKYDIPKMINNKPVQAMNYEQREYNDEFFDSLYVDLDKYKD